MSQPRDGTGNLTPLITGYTGVADDAFAKPVAIFVIPSQNSRTVLIVLGEMGKRDIMRPSIRPAMRAGRVSGMLRR